ncbi:hypothetical protein CTAYLR_002990 [Chrysophaeum taylorii]|uniref:Glycine transporter domain-containing protein n=1 Tax=Chrysophaeum taylorii TaxID=2483200 RepID=A0AAD7U518_9STRA|nr:hypothetical protein CTAYLR_002990 [Chrysophaeum taylorii]
MVRGLVRRARRGFDVVSHATRLGVELSPEEISRLRRDVTSGSWVRRRDLARMVREAQRREAERETLVGYIAKTDEKTLGQRMLLTLDFVGTSLFAVVGTQAAGQAGMNVVGGVLVGCVASMGGGTLNNIMTNNTRGGCFWMRDPRFLVIGIWSSLATFYLWPEFEEWQARKEFARLTEAAGAHTDTLTLAQFERALSAAPEVKDRLVRVAKTNVDPETASAIDAAPDLAGALIFEWLSTTRITPAELQLVARLGVMTSPFLFGLETAALGAVAVIGAQAGVSRGIGPLGSIATAVTICFGGVLRDILCHREVAIGAQSYALATCAGASVYVGLRQLVVHGILKIPLFSRILAGAFTTIAQRVYVYVSDASDHLLPPMRVRPPRHNYYHRREPSSAESLCAAAARNDVLELRIFLREMNLNANVADYDLRTPLHLAAAEGSFDAVRFLVQEGGVHLSPKDRWGRTPLDDATANSHRLVAAYLRHQGAKSGCP